MMLTIHGLPTSTNYQDLKRLIKQECNITDFILDSLVMDDDGCKKVRIGVTDDGDGSHLIKYLNGYRYSGHLIRVVPVGKPNQQNPVNFEARGSYPPRNDYQVNTNYGQRPLLHEGQQPRSNWGPKNMQWAQGIPPPVQQNTFHQPPTQQVPPIINSNFPHQQQPRGFAPGGMPQVQQNFSYPPKSNVPDHTVAVMKDNFQGPSQFHHQPPAPAHFQAQSHVQQTSWPPPVAAAKPQMFDKPAPSGYNQMVFTDNRQVPKQSTAPDSGYKDYDKGDRRFPPPRDQSPGRRPLMSPSPSGRRMTPPPAHGRRRSPSPSASARRPSPGRRMSPSRMGVPPPSGRGVSPGRRMTPPRPVGSGRGGTPPLVRKLSPQGRRMSPESYRRASPSRPHRDRASPHGGSSRRMSPGRRDSSPGQRMSPGRQSPGRRGSPRRMSPKRHSPGRRSVSPRCRTPLLEAPVGMRGSVEDNKEETADSSQNNTVEKKLVDSNSNDEDKETKDTKRESNKDEKKSGANVVVNSADDKNKAEKNKKPPPSRAKTKELFTEEGILKLQTGKQARKFLQSVSGAARKRYKALRADNVPWQKAIVMCQKRWSELPPDANPNKRARLEGVDRRIKTTESVMAEKEPEVENKKNRLDKLTAEEHPGVENKKIERIHKITAEEHRGVGNKKMEIIYKITAEEQRRYQNKKKERIHKIATEEHAGVGNKIIEIIHKITAEEHPGVENKKIEGIDKITVEERPGVENRKIEGIDKITAEEHPGVENKKIERIDTITAEEHPGVENRKIEGIDKITVEEHSGVENKKIERIDEEVEEQPGSSNKNYFLKSGRCAEVRIRNEKSMTEAKAYILLECLMTKIMQESKGEGPRFNGYGYKSGFLTISCKDKQSQLWLLDKVPKIKPWSGAKLTATLVRLVPRPMVVNVFLPESETKDVCSALKLLRLQNRGLNTEEWVIRSSQTVRGGTRATLVIDLRSAVALKEAHFQACLGFKTAYFTKAGDQPVLKARKKIKPKVTSRAQKRKRKTEKSKRNKK